MKNQINITHINQIEKYSSFPFVVEVSAFEDCGQSEYWGAFTESEAREILELQTEECKKWATKQFDDCPQDWTPGITKIYVRPEADEDGDIADLNWWETL
jgi:hypothetical protein